MVLFIKLVLLLELYILNKKKQRERRTCIAMTAFLPRRSKNIQMYCNLTNTPRDQIKYTVCIYIANK